MFLNKDKTLNLIHRFAVGVMAFLVTASCTSPIRADATDFAEEALLRKDLPIQSNETTGWPEGPAITAQSAIVMEAQTGTILYAKNIHERLFPASTTKIMTCLLAVENASLDDKIKFSNDAVFSLPPGSSNIGMDVGQSISLEQALYGILVGSANEVANAVGEHVSGSIPAFVDLMNRRAKELGCTDTHFMNTNGLQDSNHYTSAYDLALISKAFFSNELLCRVGCTPRYHFTATADQPDDFFINNKHKLINGEIPYEGIIGGKTGYTDLARETLVTCAEKDGMRLICVVFMEESPAQFTDTVTLFDYGFNNFRSLAVADSESRYMPDDSLFFESENDVFGKSGTILKLSEDSRIILPKTSVIDESQYEITYDLTDREKSAMPTAVAKVNYSYNKVPIGSAYVCYQNTSPGDAPAETETEEALFINVKLLIILAVAICIAATILGGLIGLITSGRRHSSRYDRIRFNRRKKEYKKGKLKFKR